MQDYSKLPPHANGWAKNEITGEIRAVQIKNGRCFYWGGEETEAIELGPQWKPVKKPSIALHLVIALAALGLALYGITKL